MKERFFDPVHGFIHLSIEEKKLLEHPAFTRLHYLHQTGLTYLVYPGATHSRFEHSLGVMHIATILYDQLYQVPNHYHKEALRIGALCHDLGHLPFSHTLEHVLLEEGGHEAKTIQMILWLSESEEFQVFERRYPGFLQLVLKIAVSRDIYESIYENTSYTDDELLLSSLVSGDYYGADRIDYLIRDSRCTGVSVGLFDYPQLIEMLEVSYLDNRPLVVLKEEGLHAVEGLILARHYMHSRVYRHPAVLAYNQALSDFIKKTNTLDFSKMAPNEYVNYTDAWLTDQFIKASLDKTSKGHESAKILMKQSQKTKQVQTKHPQKTFGSLHVITKDQAIEALEPTPRLTPFFQKTD